VPFLQRTLPLFVAFLAGAVGVLTFYVPAAEPFEAESATWFRIIFAFAMILGIHSLLHMHWGRVRRKGPGWAFSAVTCASFGLALLFGVYNNGRGPLGAQDLEAGGLYWLYTYVTIPAGSTMFSLLAFFVASAAYRTFRARTIEATILLAAAVVVMIGRVPFGAYLSEHLPTAALWLMTTPNMAARRGILIGVSLGAVATSLRIIFGIERAYLGEDAGQRSRGAGASRQAGG
jgi:hypothetical protein